LRNKEIYGEEDGESSHYLRATHFDFTGIPAGATIDGIVAEFEKKSDSGFIDDDHVYIVKAGTEQGTNKALGTWSTTESYVSYGGATDKWGLTWTQDLINSTDFGVSINCYNGEYDEGDIAYVDHVRITVYYTGVGPSDFYINIGDTWQDAEQIYINIGDVWQDVESVAVNVGDSWRTIFFFFIFPKFLLIFYKRKLKNDILK